MVNLMFLIYKKYAKRIILLLTLLTLIILFAACISVEYTHTPHDETAVISTDQIHESVEIETEDNINAWQTEESEETEESKQILMPDPIREPPEVEIQTPLQEPQEPSEETEPETLPVVQEEIVQEETQPRAKKLLVDLAEPVGLTTETLLEDFDYFALTLKENFPFYGAARRKFGVDLQKQIGMARVAVQNLNTTGNDDQILRGYANILAEYIVSPMRTMGHMIGLWAGSRHYNIQLALIKWDGTFETSWYPNLYAKHLLGVFTSPTAIRYYGDIFASIDVDDYIQSTLLTPVPGNVTFKILQPGSVAYIKMKGMDSANYAYDGKLIAEFAETIGDFDHLIIDLRGNQGGHAGNFTENIVAPLIDKPVSFEYYAFFMGGRHAMMFDDIYCRDIQWQVDNGLVLHTDDSRFPVADVLPSLTNANAEDFARLSYGFKREITVNPSKNRWAFKGKVWMLIDRRVYSAAEISSAICKESGFATLVGESTFGSFGGYTAAFISLPNTGIIIRYDYGYITDLQGRSLEEFGITPHITNRPGMDALETALAVIAEGSE